ncbi:phosphomannomutase/phosphoglucomutase [Haliangium sp.]|uniref:phosphomannomutase/phosphoglucomutase n=1 Tax=Haliangium sp. TaxID=2663208 RepID=UPI003D0C4EF4
MNQHIFRAYDIRGHADRDLPDPFVRRLGRAVAARLRRCDPADHADHGPRSDERPDSPLIALGRDCRLSSPRLAAALSQGLREAGAHVLELGVVPTPQVYFAAHRGLCDGAVQVTGSHNPPADNGFKILHGTAALHTDDIAALARDIERAGASEPDPTAESRGRLSQRDVGPDYLDYAVASLRLGPRRCRIVVDAGNGTGGPTALALYRRLGFDVVGLYCDMDGRFPNHHPDPLDPDNLSELRRRVQAEGAELGLAFDGDADRVAAVDERGRILWGDQLLILFGRALLAEHPGATVVTEVKCSSAVESELTRLGGHVYMGQAGHSLVKAAMRARGALLAGELSGHIFFADRWPGFDDGIYAGARLLELVSRGDERFAAHCDTLPVMVNTPELRVASSDSHKRAVVAHVTQALRAHPEVVSVLDVDGIRANVDGGWGLVRASNTQADIVLRCEAVDQTRLAAIRRLLEKHVAQAQRAVGDPALSD